MVCLLNWFLITYLFCSELVVAAKEEVFTNPYIDESVYPVCANVTYKGNTPDVTQLLYDCVDNMASAGECVRLYWTDERLNFPSYWDAVFYNTTNPVMIHEGVDITRLVRWEGNPLLLWLPDIHFVDGKEVTVLEETINIRPGGLMFWSRHTVAVIQQPGFEYSKYPGDEQTVEIRVESYAYNSEFVLLDFTYPGSRLPGNFTPPNPVNFVSNGVVMNFEKSPIWSYDSYYTQVLQPSYFDGAAYYPQPVVYMKISRQSAGIVYRLAFPIMLMLLLVGLTFWEATENRVDTTINILLAVSALYIVIFSSIPMLGYLTHFDFYIISMFIMIVGAVFVHQLTDRLISKLQSHPLRMIMVRILELAGKILLMPGVVIYFLYSFPNFESDSAALTMVLAVVGFSVYVSFREWKGFKRTIRDCMLLIRVKVENPSAHELSGTEVFLFNLYSFGVFSRSASHYHQWKRMNDKQYMTRDSTTSDMSEDNSFHGSDNGNSSRQSSKFDRAAIMQQLQENSSTYALHDDDDVIVEKHSKPTNIKVSANTTNPMRSKDDAKRANRMSDMYTL